MDPDNLGKGQNTLSWYPDKKRYGWAVEALVVVTLQSLEFESRWCTFFESACHLSSAIFDAIHWTSTDHYKALKNGQKELNEALKLSKKRESAAWGDE